MQLLRTPSNKFADRGYMQHAVPHPMLACLDRLDSSFCLLEYPQVLAGNEIWIGLIHQYVALPPEISNTAPVEKEHSSDASHATSAAISSTLPKRFIGILDSM